jgi:hypothetical protein
LKAYSATGLTVPLKRQSTQEEEEEEEEEELQHEVTESTCRRRGSMLWSLVFTIFINFRQKMGDFLENNDMIHFLRKLLVFRVKSVKFSPIFRRKKFKIIALTPPWKKMVAEPLLRFPVVLRWTEG